MKLIYLLDDLDSTIDRLYNDPDFANCKITKRGLAKTVKSFLGDEIASSVFLKKYALRDENNKILEYTLDEAKNRWAGAMVDIDQKFPKSKDKAYFRELYDYMLPAGRQMYALGNEFVPNATLSNCYVIKIEEDSLEGIYDAAKKMAKTYSYGGGVGICVGELRPNHTKVSNSARYSSGAVSFMELYSMTTGLIGQCIAEGELVLTENGLKPIQNIKVGEKVWTKKGYKKVLNTFYNGKKEILKITDTYGFNIKVSSDHIFLTEENGELKEKRARDFNINDNVVLIPGTNQQKQKYIELKTYNYKKHNGSNKLNDNVNLPTILNEDFAYILGYSYGDGGVDTDCFGEPSSLSLSCSDDWEEIKNQLDSLIFSVFNYRAKKTRGDGQLDLLSLHSKLILHHLQNNGLLKQKAGNLVFPDKILQSPPSVQMAFVSGFFDADGKKITKKRGYVVSIIDEDFLNTMKNVLMSNGIASKIYIQKRKEANWQTLYSLSICGAHSQSLAREYLSKSVKVRSANFCSKRDSYMTPYNAKTFGINYNKYDHINNTDYLSCNSYMKYCRASNNYPELLINSKIKSIEKVDNMRTYDIEVEDEHMFFCNGFYVHNSARRGALMISIPVDHPDIEDFIEIKHNNIDKVKHANISIKITDEFMNAVLENKDFTLRFNTNHEKVEKTVNARDLWQKICQSARDSAEPGLLFWDNAVKMSPSEIYDGMQIHTTNPCGEQYLPPGNSCVLSSIILNNCVKNPFTEKSEFDFDLLKEMVARGVRHLDNIVEINIGKHALKEQDESSRQSRRIGLGITGLGDTFAYMGIRYDTQKALDLAEKIMKTKMEAEYIASSKLAQERGSFPAFDPDRHFNRGFCSNLPNYVKKECKKGLRNVAISTVAPNGSLSIMAQCSSGIEPIFAFSYNRFVELGGERKSFKIYHQGLTKFFDITENTKPNAAWVEAHNIDYSFRVKLQGIIQKYIDSSISSTINVPEYTTTEEVAQIYIDAWKEGLKGITVYREGSREGILVTDEFADKEILNMDTTSYCVRAEGGDKFYVMISYKNSNIKHPYQLFVLNYKKKDNDAFIKMSNSLMKMLKENGVSEKRIEKYNQRSSNSLAKLTRFISLSMKTKHLDKAILILDEHAYVGSLSSKLYQILSKSVEARKPKCEKCGSSNVKMEEGCMMCIDCGSSKCG